VRFCWNRQEPQYGPNESIICRARLAAFPAHTSRQVRFPPAETRLRGTTQFNLPCLAHAIHSSAKFRAILDASIRTRPEDTR
jgi:hypothetical protein